MGTRVLASRRRCVRVWQRVRTRSREHADPALSVLLSAARRQHVVDLVAAVGNGALRRDPHAGADAGRNCLRPPLGSHVPGSRTGAVGVDRDGALLAVLQPAPAALVITW